MKTDKIRLSKARRHDFVMIFVFLALAGSLWLIFSMANKHGAMAIILVDGNEFGRYPLERDAVIEVKTDNGANTVVISDGKVSVTRASCPDGLCVRHSPIDRSGIPIVCLPNRLTVYVEGKASGDVDIAA